MKPGEIYVGKFPFGDVPGMKLRPLLLLAGPVGLIPEFVAAYISSKHPVTVLASDIVIDPSKSEHRSTKLKRISVLRLHKLATLHQSSFMRYLGKLSPTAELIVAGKLRALFGL